MALEVDYSNNSNNLNNTTNFNVLSSINSDPSSYKNRLQLATKNMSYYVNSLNNISGLDNDDSFLTFTPVGNAQQVNIPNLFDRPIPSTLQTTPSIYTMPYSTSPFFGSSNNINTFDTDTDLSLKTGLAIRSKNNRAHLSEKHWPSFGDVHAEELSYTVQNAGQHNNNNNNNNNIENFSNDDKVFNPNIPGLDITPSQDWYGVGVVSLNAGANYWLSSTNALKNMVNGPFLDCPQYKEAQSKESTI